MENLVRGLGALLKGDLEGWSKLLGDDRSLGRHLAMALLAVNTVAVIANFNAIKEVIELVRDK